MPTPLIAQGIRNASAQATGGTPTPTPAPFTPDSLFTASNGYAFDASNKANLYQNSARTTPVAAVNDPIGGILDLSGKAKHFFINTSNSGTAAAWKTLGGRNCVQGDGANSLLESGSFAKNPANGYTRIYALYLPVDPAALIIGCGTGSANGYNMGQTQIGAQASLHAAIYDGTLLDGAGALGIATGQWFVLAEIHKSGAASLQKNLGTPVTGDCGSTTTDGTVICGGIFGGRVTTGYAGAIEIDRVLSGTELTNAIKWVGATAGLSL